MRAALAALLLAPALAACLAPASDQATPAGAGAVATLFDTSGPFPRVLQPGPHGILPGEVLTIESALDGAVVAMAVVRPDVPDGVRVPVVVQISPYFAAFVAGTGLPASGSLPSAFLVENFVPYGYAVALVAARGTGASGGCFDFLGPAEREDARAAVAHLAAQPWSDGNVALVGHSYEGGLALQAAGAGDPAVRTVVAFSPATNVAGLVTRNGTVSGVFGTLPVLGIVGFGVATAAVLGPDHVRAPERSIEAACPALADAASADASLLATGSTAGGWWDARDPRVDLEARFGGSLFLVHTFDDRVAFPHLTIPWKDALAERGILAKEMYGLGDHRGLLPGGPVGGVDARWDLAETLLRWFDRELRGEQRDVGPPVELQDSSGAWRREETWPPADAAWTQRWLAADGALAAEAGSPAGSALLLPDGTRLLTPIPPGPEPTTPSAPGWAAFATEALDAETRIAGLPQLHLTVRPTGPGGHVTAVLAVDDGARREPLAWAQMDLRFAHGGNAPEAVTPGEAMLAPLEFEPLDAVLPAGARLVVLIGQGGMGSGLDPTAPTRFGAFIHYRAPIPTYPVEVTLGGEASVLRFQTFERSPGDARFFEPPGRAR